jgi:hypothetical protein
MRPLVVTPVPDRRWVTDTADRPPARAEPNPMDERRVAAGALEDAHDHQGDQLDVEDVVGAHDSRTTRLWRRNREVASSIVMWPYLTAAAITAG